MTYSIPELLFELKSLEVIVHPQRYMVYCLLCNEFLLLWLLCYYSVSHFDLGEKFMESPLATSLLRSRTLSVEAKAMIVQRLNMTICRHLSLRTVQWPFQWGSSWQEVVIWGRFTMQLILMSSIKTQISYVSFIHNQHQCFKQNRKKEEINVFFQFVFALNLKNILVKTLQFYFLSTDQRFYFNFNA